MSPFECFIAFKGSNLYILFAVTAACIVPGGGPKSIPVHHKKVQIIFYLGPLRSVKIFIIFTHV